MVPGQGCVQVLNIENISQTYNQLVPYQKGICGTYTLGGSLNALIINDSGLYSLILRAPASS